MAGDDAIAACYPAPFELPQKHPDRELEQARLVRIWKRLGFTHFRDGVFTLDPTSGDLEQALAELMSSVIA